MQPHPFPLRRCVEISKALCLRFAGDSGDIRDVRAVGTQQLPGRRHSLRVSVSLQHPPCSAQPAVHYDYVHHPGQGLLSRKALYWSGVVKASHRSGMAEALRRSVNRASFRPGVAETSHRFIQARGC